MIVSPLSVLKLVLIVLAALVLQVSGLTRMTVLGGNADLVPLVVAAIAFLAGSVPGAVTGFAAGLMLDLALGQTVGAASLVLTTVGYAVGRYREVRDPAHALAPIAYAAAATAGYGFGLAAVSFMLGIEASVSVLVLRETILTILLNMLLALPVFWLLRRVLGGSLLADPIARGRHQRTRATGPLGLRGLEVGR